MPKLYTYIVSEDTGLAPNPFFQCCTLAVGLPNHMHAKAWPGDWIAGFFAEESGFSLLFAMPVEKRMKLSAYFHTQAFQNKKPDPHGTSEEKCGDNFYSLENGAWLQHPTIKHRGDRHRKRDTRHNPPVFASRTYWYFGKNAVALPEAFNALVPARGLKVNHGNPELAEAFMEWVRGYRPGMYAYPRDFEESPPDEAGDDACSIFRTL